MTSGDENIKNSVSWEENGERRTEVEKIQQREWNNSYNNQDLLLVGLWEIGTKGEMKGLKLE